MNSVYCLFEKEFTEHFTVLSQSLHSNVLFDFKLYQSCNELEYLESGLCNILFLYINIKRCLDKDFNILYDFVYNGGTLVAFHSSFASFNNQPKSIDLFGAKFMHHGPIRKFNVLKQTCIPYYTSVDSFEITDELFRQKYIKGLNILYSYIGRTVEEPIIWENKLGSGIVLGISLGHQASTFKNPYLINILTDFLKQYI